MGKGRHLEYKSSNGYTGSRSINTFKELVKLVEEFPEMRKKLDEDFERMWSEEDADDNSI